MLTEFGWPVGDELFSSIWAEGAVELSDADVLRSRA